MWNDFRFALRTCGVRRVRGGAMLVIAGAALCATLAPALRAMRIEPVRALKYEEI
jgi:hypothetical protein